MFCVNKNLKEYQTQLSRSGISDSEFEHQAAHYLEKYGRYPYLDEIPNADSSKYIKQNLEVYGNQTSYVKLNKVEEFTVTDSKEQAQKKLNSIFRDKEIELIDFDENTSIIKITDRPSKYKQSNEEVDIENPDSFSFFVDNLYKFTNLYGINFKMITDKQMQLQPFNNLHASEANAFIYNGDIYINVDKASLDSPIHEMLHLLIGSMRFTNQDVYNNLLAIVQKFSDFQFMSRNFPNRTINDVSEEILVDQLSKFLTTGENRIGNEYLYDIFYELRRNLDTLLMGNYSVGNVNINDLKDMSLLELGKIVNSKSLTSKNKLNDAFVHRITNNIKSDLIKKGELEQICV